MLRCDEQRGRGMVTVKLGQRNQGTAEKNDERSASLDDLHRFPRDRHSFRRAIRCDSSPVPVHPNVRVFASPAEVAAAAADLFIGHAQAANSANRPFRVALAGGSTPRAFHPLIAARQAEVDWSLIDLFWGDERHVSPDDPDSNYRMARETLLDQVPLRPDQIHRIPSERPDPAAAAALYQQELARVFGVSPPSIPRFDLVFLGMGPDGHTASLFPGTTGLEETKRWVAASWIGRLATHRITLTFPVLNAARAVVFTATGADKADVLAQVLTGGSFPAARVLPTDGTLTWLIDAAAAERWSRDGREHRD